MGGLLSVQIRGPRGGCSQQFCCLPTILCNSHLRWQSWYKRPFTTSRLKVQGGTGFILWICSVNFTSTKQQGSDQIEECRLLVIHYSYFVISVNQYIYFGTSCIINQFKKNARNANACDVVEERLIYKRNARGSVGNLLWPILCWYMTYHLYCSSLTVLFMVTMTIPNQVTYFLNHLGPGNTEKQYKTDSHAYWIHLLHFTVLKDTDIKLIHQWQITLLIIHSAGFVVKLFFDLASVAKQDWKFSSVFVLSSVKNYISSAESYMLSASVMICLAIFTYTFTKNYLDEYVHLDKI